MSTHSGGTRGSRDAPRDLGGLRRVVDADNGGIEQERVLHKHGLELRGRDCMSHVRYACPRAVHLTDLGIPAGEQIVVRVSVGE